MINLPQLVPQWRSALKFHSIRGIGAAGALLATYEALPTSMQATFTPAELHWTAIIILCLAALGSLIKQDLPQ